MTYKVFSNYISSEEYWIPENSVIALNYYSKNHLWIRDEIINDVEYSKMINDDKYQQSSCDSKTNMMFVYCT